MTDFEAIANAAFGDLPEPVKEICADVLFQVSDFAHEEVLTHLGLTSPYQLLGLFEGIGLAQTGGAAWTGRMPNRIWLYRQPILAYGSTREDRLEDIIKHVLVHEIGHHFGLSDADMEAIDQAED
ncbi:MAG: metallopeptidase family protein [Stappiaceae bacterium]